MAHPANVLVMGPGGYRFVDCVKLGVRLTLLVFALAMLLLPRVWPLRVAGRGLATQHRRDRRIASAASTTTDRPTAAGWLAAFPAETHTEDDP